ncbi:hypothetical protein EPR50_G00022070 [Perca flavescens]|uniref:C-type lectin domain-containing protein n=1 Tax=Perca flavescens TaxID=8167 RepID=A0A484DMN7_PERFV|nr:ladderlectin-like [Perca flavescens]TDH16613.1 hypothetical protein EPR50_G00022070 [Perca flavescens]
MKILLVLSVLLCAALSIRAATVVPAEGAAVPQDNKPAPESEMDAATHVADGRGPVRPQARFDFCLDGWLSFRGNCYFLANQVSSWSNAERYCAGFGGSLASVHNVLEYNFLQRLVKTGGHTFAWIGGFYFQGCWRWEDGSVFDYTNQGSMSSTSSYQCLQVNSQTSKGWSNNGCTINYPFVCQIKPNC